MATFQTELAVSMTCESCVEEIRTLLRNQPGVEKYDIDLKEQRILVEGRAPPSKIARALKDAGRRVIVRGAGTSDGTHDAAAVCIFESHAPSNTQSSTAPSMNVHGIARLIQVKDQTVLDLSLRYEPMGGQDGPDYYAYVAKTGDLSKGAASTGGIFHHLGKIDMLRDKEGRGDLFVEIEGLKLWEVIGRAMVIAPALEKGEVPKLGEGILAGVVARSAGAWGTSTANDKTICSCSGMTMWEEERIMPNL